MTEIRETLRFGDINLEELNRVMGRLQDRLDELEGRRGTPEFYSNVDMKSNRVTNVSPSVNQSDVVIRKELDDYDATLIAPNLLAYTPSSIVVVTGTPATGSNVSQVQTLLDGNVYQLREVAATPGFNIDFRFSNVTDFHAVVTRYRYDGSVSHWVGLDLYHISEVYKQFALMPLTSTYYNWVTIYGIDSSNYIDSANNVKLRSYHYTAGNASHYIYYDYVALLKYIV